jgi:large subunit ribosomal protein L25
MTTVSLEAEATHLPTAVEVSVEGRAAGEHVHASDLVLPKGTLLLADADALVVNVSEAVEIVEEEEAGAEAAPAAEGEESSEAAAE